MQRLYGLLPQGTGDAISRARRPAVAYETILLPLADGATIEVIKPRPNGDCLYLGPGGCTIHDRAPAICRAFGCRKYFASLLAQRAPYHGADVGA